jgi:hypothetical protein
MKSRKRDSAKNVEEKSVEQQEANEKVLQLREEVNNVAERRQDFDAGKSQMHVGKVTCIFLYFLLVLRPRFALMPFFWTHSIFYLSSFQRLSYCFMRLLSLGVRAAICFLMHSGAAFHEHRIDSLDHAVELTNAAEAAVEEGVKNAKRIDDAVSLLHRILQMPKAKQELWNVKDLKRKYCHKVGKNLWC